jgi:hypothetical protein
MKMCPIEFIIAEREEESESEIKIRIWIRIRIGFRAREFYKNKYIGNINYLINIDIY